MNSDRPTAGLQAQDTRRQISEWREKSRKKQSDQDEKIRELTAVQRQMKRQFRMQERMIQTLQPIIRERLGEDLGDFHLNAPTSPRRDRRLRR